MARTLRDIQRDRQEAKKLEHKQMLAEKFGLVGHPKLDKLYDVAWNFGHANEIPTFRRIPQAWLPLLPEAYANLDRQMFEGGVKMPSGSYMTVKAVSLHMASAALEVLKLAFDNAGLDAE